MNMLNSFVNFYSNLSSDGLFLFWIVVFLFCFLIFLCVVLLIKNNNLMKLLEEERNNLQNHEEEINKDTDNSDILNIAENNTPFEETVRVTEVNSDKKEDIKEDHPSAQEKVEVKKVKDETGPYSKNVLREISGRMQTSPIHIEREDEPSIYDVSSINVSSDSNFASPLEEMEDVYEMNDNMRFASKIVEQMEEEIKPSNIELTDYEKKQEEEAIISYDELLQVKDKIYNITEDEETDDFIDELKSFRLDLK